MPFDLFAEVEKMLHFKFGDKERERSNRAVGIADKAQGTRRGCPRQHSQIAWTGPPHETNRAYVCIVCGAAASEAEIVDRGLSFDTVLHEIILEIMDLDLQRQGAGNATSFAVGGP